MKIQLNNQLLELPVEVTTAASLIKWKGFPADGTALAINNRLIRRAMWASAQLQEGDRVTVISAAFGG